MRRQAGALVAAVALVLAGCSSQEPVSQETLDVSRDIDLVDARREAIGLELELYDLLSTEFGVGQWEAPPEDGLTQVFPSAFIECASGYQSESWILASAGPIPDDRWEEAITTVGEFLEPRGFTKIERFEPGNGDHMALYTNETTGARVQIGYKLATGIAVDTGCARGEFYGNWPDGTELIPTRLRTSGRGRADLEHEIWPTETPNG